jgi:hypothetical protein
MESDSCATAVIRHRQNATHHRIISRLARSPPVVLASLRSMERLRRMLVPFGARRGVMEMKKRYNVHVLQLLNADESHTNAANY